MRIVAAPLTHVGSAYFGYSDFSNFDTWKDDTTLQLGGRTASPIVMGAAAGSFFGPPGALIGAGAGAIGETAGVGHALVRLDYKEDSQWRERGVRDSIQGALNGFVLSESDPRVAGRPRVLNAEEASVIDTHTKELVLRRIFGAAGDPKDKFSDKELVAAGFVPVKPSATAEEQSAAGEHNWNRIAELMDGVENNYNPFTTWSHLDQLKQDNRAVASRFESTVNQSNHYYTDLYRRSMQVTYTNTRESSAVWSATKEIAYSHWASPIGYIFSRGNQDGGGVTTKNEALEFIDELAADFKAKFDAREKQATTPALRSALAEEQWKYFYDLSVDARARKFPELEFILADENTRRTFLNYFEHKSGRPLTEYAMWKDMANCRTGAHFLQGPLNDKFVGDQLDLALSTLEKSDLLTAKSDR